MTRLLFSAICVFSMYLSAGASADLADSLATINGVDKDGRGHREAMAAYKAISAQSADKLPDILKGMNDAGPLATNWLRSAVETIVARELAGEGKPPVDQLNQFVLDTSNGARARRLAYEVLQKADAGTYDRLIPGMLNDPSLELRRDAVTFGMQQAADLAADKPNEAIAKYQQLLVAARDLDQIQAIADQLKELGRDVNLPKALGVIADWKVIGPFDNTGGIGFTTPAPPEKEFNATAAYVGKTGDVRWTDDIAIDDFGRIDLNKTVEMLKEVTAYGRTIFVSGQARDVQFRLGTYNAAKIWLNGELVFASEVYHSGEKFDQYIAPAKLKKGENVILLKCLQNEQTQPWAKYWRFQFRITDELGTPITSK